MARQFTPNPLKGAKDPLWWVTGTVKKKKNNASADALGGFQFQPYGGVRPPQPEFLRPTEKQLYEILSNRSKGIDVGFDPQRRQLLTELATSQNMQRRNDDVRSAAGSLAAAGLSGNARAIEASKGRVERDSARSLQDSITQIAIEDLTRANDERDINTQRFQNFNNFNFGQANKVADFDLDVYNAEQGNQRFASSDDLARQQFATQQSQFNQSRSDDQFNDMSGLALAGADLFLASKGVPPGTASAAAQALAGKGIAPESKLQTPSFYNQPLRSRRQIGVR